MRTIRALPAPIDWDNFDALLSNAVEGFTVAQYAARQGISFQGAYGKLEIARAQGKLTRAKDGAAYKYNAVKGGTK